MNSRRAFIINSATTFAGITVGLDRNLLGKSFLAKQINIVNPKNRPPLSFIIDDSTTLVNMAYFGIPQFAEVFPDRYKQNWQQLPREIPDDFVREFRDYCQEHGVKGKYSIVPYPACTGWVDRFIPGWSKRELQDSLKLVRDTMQPDWDIHPEMISHTRVIDIKTGRPYPFADEKYMENWGWSQDKSADELGEYLAYALNVLKNAGLNCEGITTPGGFGSNNKENLAQATLLAVREVYGKVDVAHYFRDLYTDDKERVTPLVKYPSDLQGNDPRCVVSVIGCTGDWFGGWDGLNPGTADKFISADLETGRMVDVIERGEPAIMVCHWPGIYYNGEKVGLNVFKEVVSRLEQKYGQLNWMKNSEIARYWAAKTHTKISLAGKEIELEAPFATDNFTIEAKVGRINQPGIFEENHQVGELKQVKSMQSLQPGTYFKDKKSTLMCFNLTKGKSYIKF